MSNTPASSKPKYPIPWIATYFIAALVLIVGSYVVVWFIERPSSKFDYANPDMKFLEAIVLSDDPRHGDFSGLNGGDWKVLCLAGWQGDLKKALTASEIEAEPARALQAQYEAVSSQMEESEFVLVYSNGQGEAKAVHHPHGFAFARSGTAACTRRDTPMLRLPVKR